MSDLLALAQQLEARGADAHTLRELHMEMAALERPLGMLGRLRQRVGDLAKRNADRIRAELGESREMARIIRRRVARQEVSEDELILVREQLFDLMRVVPAALVVATNYTLPVPGTSFLTPWMLARLGLLPTRWREARILETLQKEAARLRDAGFDDLADELGDIEQTVEVEADARAQAQHDAALLTHWDANQDGIWQAEEQAAYLTEVQRLAVLAPSVGLRRRWFLQTDGRIFGPLALPSLSDLDTELELLVCYDGKSGWVDLRDLLEAC